jgi:quercetin dioxygenase-like cupin family protein
MATTRTTAPIVRTAEEGERRWFHGGGVHTWKATAEETAGAFLLFEMELDVGKMTPLHTHPDSDESMFVVRGEILVHVDGQEHPVGPGGLAVAPRGLPHAFLVTAGPAAVLCLHTPGCCEAFYRDASEPLAPGEAGSGIVDFGLVRASAARNGGIEILGPPPFAAPGEAEPDSRAELQRETPPVGS